MEIVYLHYLWIGGHLCQFFLFHLVSYDFSWKQNDSVLLVLSVSSRKTYAKCEMTMEIKREKRNDADKRTEFMKIEWVHWACEDFAVHEPRIRYKVKWFTFCFQLTFKTSGLHRHFNLCFVYRLLAAGYSNIENWSDLLASVLFLWFFSFFDFCLFPSPLMLARKPLTNNSNRT